MAFLAELVGLLFLVAPHHVVLVEPWDWQDEKADIAWRYEKQEADQLRQEGHIQEQA